MKEDLDWNNWDVEEWVEEEDYDEYVGRTFTIPYGDSYKVHKYIDDVSKYNGRVDGIGNGKHGYELENLRSGVKFVMKGSPIGARLIWDNN